MHGPLHESAQPEAVVLFEIELLLLPLLLLQLLSSCAVDAELRDIDAELRDIDTFKEKAHLRM